MSDLPACLIAALIAVAPSCGAGTSARLAINDPMGVLCELTITTSYKKLKIMNNISPDRTVLHGVQTNRYTQSNATERARPRAISTSKFKKSSNT